MNAMRTGAPTAAAGAPKAVRGSMASSHGRAMHAPSPCRAVRLEIRKFAISPLAFHCKPYRPHNSRSQTLFGNARGATLVPKLCLGTHGAKLRFASRPERETEFPECRSQTEFGNESNES